MFLEEDGTWYDRLLAEGLTPEAIEQIIQIQIEQGRVPLLESDLEYYTGIAATPMPEGRGFGRIYTSAHPLEALATGLQRARGARGRKGTQVRQEEALKRQQEGRLSALGYPSRTRTQAPRTSMNEPVATPARTTPLAPLGTVSRGRMRRYEDNVPSPQEERESLWALGY